MNKMFFVILAAAMFAAVFSQTQTEFEIGADWLNNVNRPGGTAYTMTSQDWNNITDLGLKWGEILYKPWDNISYANSALAGAAAHGIKIILERYKFRPPIDGQRWQYHPEYSVQYPTSGLTGANVIDNSAEIFPDATLGSVNARWAIAGTDAPGYLAKGLLVNNEQTDGFRYYVKVRIRLANNTPLTHSSVVTVSAVRLSDGASQSQTIYADDPAFQSGDHYVYKEITAFYFEKNSSGSMIASNPASIQFVPEPNPPLGHSGVTASVAASGSDFDYRVYWNGQVTCYLDYVIVDNANANTTFTGGYDAAINQEINNFKASAGLGRFKLRDEIDPDYYGQYLTTGYVEKLVKENVAASGYPTKTGAHYNTGFWQVARTGSGQEYIGRDIAWTQNNQSLVDIYPIGSNLLLPDAPSYTQTYQNAIQNYLIKYLQMNIDYANKYAVPFWFAPQAHSNTFPDSPLREPTTTELKQMVNLGLAYGAKGIHYFLYWTVFDGTYTMHGLVETDGTPRHTIYSGTSYAGDKWATVKAINQELAGAVGETLVSLTWLNAFSINQGQPIGTYISQVTTSDQPLATYVELGTFKETDQINNNNLEYFFVVNRRTLSTEQRNITVTVNKSSSSNDNWKLTEVGTSNTWIISKTGSFETLYQPGEGKLFRMESIIAGGTLTIPSGEIWNFQPGVTLTFNSSSSLIVNGTLNVNGTSSNPVTFDFSGDYLAKGIQINPDGHFDISYAIIDGPGIGMYVNEGWGTMGNTEFNNHFTDLHLYRTNYSTGNVYLTDNTFSAAEEGLILEYSSPKLVGNKFSGSQYGIQASNYSSAQLGYVNQQGRNVFDYCQWGSITGYNNCDLFLGKADCITNGGYNSFKFNSMVFLFPHIDVSNYCQVTAEQNWWGRSSPSMGVEFVANGSSSIDYTPYLTSDPNQLAKIIAGKSPEEAEFDNAFVSSSITSTSAAGGVTSKAAQLTDGTDSLFSSYLSKIKTNKKRIPQIKMVNLN